MTRKPSLSMNLKPTHKQEKAIDSLSSQLGTTPVHTPTNRREARDLIYKLRIQLREKEVE